MGTNWSTLSAAAFILSGCTFSTAQDAVDATSFKERMASNPGTLVDVRSAEEWEQGVIDGALLIDFHGDDFFKRIAALDRERPVYLYCAVGGRSHLAAVQLLKLGHAQVVDLDGGIEAWVEAGYPVVLPGKTGNR